MTVHYENDSRCSLCIEKLTTCTRLFLNLSADPQLKNIFQLKQQNLECDNDIQSSPTLRRNRDRFALVFKVKFGSREVV